MADGTFAVLMLVFGLADMHSNYCGTEIGCFGRTETTSRVSLSAGEVLERRAKPAGEVYARYDFGHKTGPFGLAAGLSYGEHGETWVGIGQTLDLLPDGNGWFAQLHSMPGLYFPNGGFDLGGTLEFRSGIEVGYEASSGWRFGLGYDHRSNAGIYSRNPGIETVHLRVSMPLN